MNTKHKDPYPDLAEHLRRWAEGSDTVEAAVGLLIAHGTWLDRAEFRRCAVWVQWSRETGLAWAAIDWEAAAQAVHEVPASSSERAVLSIALSLADGEYSVDLANALSSLDERNTALVLEAIAHACGVQKGRRQLLITDRRSG